MSNTCQKYLNDNNNNNNKNHQILVKYMLSDYQIIAKLLSKVLSNNCQIVSSESQLWG